MLSRLNLFRTALFDRPLLLLTLTALFWGGNAVASRSAAGEVSPMTLTALRWVLVVVIAAPFALPGLRQEWPLIRPRLLSVAIMGTMGFTVFNALFYVAGYFTTAVNIGIIQGSIPVFVLAGAFVALRAPVGAIQIVGVVVTLIGVGVVATRGDMARLATFTLEFGDLLMVIACVGYAGYTVALKNRPAISGLTFFYAMAIVALTATMPLLAAEIALGKATMPTAKGWAILAYIAVFPSFIGQIFYLRGVDMVGPGRAGLFVNLVPVFAAILAVAILGETFELFHGIALALVLGGIWLAERGKKPNKTV